MRSIEYLKMAGEVKELTRHINFIIEKGILVEGYESEGIEVLALAIATINTMKDYFKNAKMK